MMKVTDYVSPYNTDKVKYTGPLAIVTYTGDKNGENQMHGYGEVLFANGATYKGHFVQDMMHGYGEMVDPMGSVYKGDFFEDKRQGNAIFTYADGVYEGEYFNNRRHGKGKETDKAGNVFEGTFENGDFIKGKISYANGDIYVGECKDDCKHGRGRLLLCEEGDELDGMWEDDQFVGEVHTTN